MVGNQVTNLRALVTGGCGFIGSHLVKALVANTNCLSIVNVDALTYSGHPENCSDIDNVRYKFKHQSINDRPSLENTLREENISIIFHLAAESHVDRSIHSIEPFISTNVDGTRVILESILALRKEGQEISLVHVSTDEVYGSLGPNDPPFTELTPVNPLNPYAATKAASDFLVKSFVNTFNISAVITRCSNNYGPNQFPEKLVPLMILKTRLGEKLPIYGDGKNVRDWIHVTDHVDGIVSSANALISGKLTSGEVINFGGENEKTNLEIVRNIVEKIGASDDLIEFVPDRPGHDKRYAIDISKAKKLLKWSPKINWDHGISQTILWYKSNDKWVASITSGEYKNWIRKQYGDTK